MVSLRQKRKKKASEETAKGAQKIDGKRPINWKSIGKTCKLELLMSHSDDSSLFQVVFFLAWSKLPFFHLFGYGRLSPSSIQSLLHDLLAERCSDAYSPCIFQTNNQLVLLQLLARDTVRVSVVRVLYFKEIGLQSSSKNGDESTQFIFMNFIKIRKGK